MTEAACQCPHFSFYGIHQVNLRSSWSVSGNYTHLPVYTQFIINVCPLSAVPLQRIGLANCHWHSGLAICSYSGSLSRGLAQAWPDGQLHWQPHGQSINRKIMFGVILFHAFCMLYAYYINYFNFELQISSWSWFSLIFQTGLVFQTNSS